MNFETDFSDNIFLCDKKKIKKEFNTLKFQNVQLYKLFKTQQLNYSKLYQEHNDMIKKNDYIEKRYTQAYEKFNKYFDMYIDVVKLLAKAREKKRYYKLNAFNNQKKYNII